MIDIDDTDPPAGTGPGPVRLRPEDLASISLTGGSTGVPKGVPRYAAVPAYGPGGTARSPANPAPT